MQILILSTIFAMEMPKQWSENITVDFFTEGLQEETFPVQGISMKILNLASVKHRMPIRSLRKGGRKSYRLCPV